MRVTWQEVVAGFWSMPLYARVIVVLAACFAVFTVVEKALTKARHRDRFRTLARELGGTLEKRGGWPQTFSCTVDGRRFDVQYDLRVRHKYSSYRGPLGHLLITTTSLAGSGWSMHQVDIARRRSRWIAAKRSLTGDPAFDDRFVVIEDGLHVRDGWFDAGTREAVAEFLGDVNAQGPIWIRDGRFSYYLDRWMGFDGRDLHLLLQRQAVLASAFDRTAQRRI